MTSVKDVLNEILHTHIWGENYPDDEADCCVQAILADPRLLIIRTAYEQPPGKPMAGDVFLTAPGGQTAYVGNMLLVASMDGRERWVDPEVRDGDMG